MPGSRRGTRRVYGVPRFFLERCPSPFRYGVGPSMGQVLSFLCFARGLPTYGDVLRGVALRGGVYWTLVVTCRVFV